MARAGIWEHEHALTEPGGWRRAGAGPGASPFCTVDVEPPAGEEEQGAALSCVKEAGRQPDRK
jgi:hypothetical protein